MKEREVQEEDFDDEEIGPQAEGMDFSTIMFMVVVAIILTAVIQAFKTPDVKPFVECRVRGYNCTLSGDIIQLENQSGATLPIELVRER